MTKTSIIILVHNQSELFKKCLGSIVHQLTNNDKVIVVNNKSSKNETKKIINIIKKHQRNNIHYFFNNTNSIPKGRNKGLLEMPKDTKIVAFIDDDCAARRNWLENIKTEHQAHQNWEAIQGKVTSIPKENLYARLTGLTYKNWLKSNRLDKNTLRTLDSKNVSFKTRVFRTGLRFNEKLTRSSDIDLGHRLREKGFKIGYSSKIKIYHQEKTSLYYYLKQHANIAKGESETKSTQLIPKRYKYHLISFKNLTLKFLQEGHLILFFKFLFLIPIVLTLRAAVFLSHLLRCKS